MRTSVLSMLVLVLQAGLALARQCPPVPENAGFAGNLESFRQHCHSTDQQLMVLAERVRSSELLWLPASDRACYEAERIKVMDDTTNYLRIASQRDYHTHCTVLERNVLKYTLRKIQRDPTLLRGP